MESSLEVIPGWQWWMLVALLFGSFFFAGSETALTSLGEAKARQLWERLGKRGAILSLWIHKPKEVLTCLLIGNNLVNIAASALATNIALILFGSAALAVATGVTTLLVLVFGEITPKTLAREHAERVAVPILFILRPFYFLSFPAVWLLSKLTGFISDVFGGKESDTALPVTGEEIDYLIGLGSRYGALEGVKRDLLKSVLEFSELTVKEIMNPRTSLVTLEVSTPYDEVVELIHESEHSRIPVYEQGIDNIVGVFYVKDILGRIAKGDSLNGGFDLREYVRPALFVPEVMEVSRLMKEMQSLQTHMAVVVDEFGGTSGIVTLEDIVEEIVGDIRDEHDIEAQPLRLLPDGRMLVDASVPLREIEEVLNIEFPEEGDYETLGGFLTATAGRVPPVGSLVVFSGYTFLVRASNIKCVLKTEISPSKDERVHNSSESDGEGKGESSGENESISEVNSSDTAVERGSDSAHNKQADEPRFFLGPLQ